MVQRNQCESGQVLLITLLVLSVATTVALSLLGRGTTNQAISNQVEESARAFSAAEAGIETALQSGAGATGSLTIGQANISYNVSQVSLGGTSGVYVFPKKTSKGSTEVLWLAEHDDSTGLLKEIAYYKDPSLDVCWSGNAIVVSILYKKGGNYQLARGAFDPSPGAPHSNYFTQVNPTGGCGQSVYYKQTITFSDYGISNVSPGTDILLALRIRPLYGDIQLAVNSSAALPKQGNQFTSSGSTDTGVTRNIVVNQQYRAASSIFDYAVYSQSDFSH